MRHSVEDTKLIKLIKTAPLAVLGLAMCAPLRAEAQQPLEVKVDWNKVVGVSKTSPTLQVVVNPMLRPGSPIVKQSYQAVQELGADYVRYVPWLPYPKLAVAELQPPAADKTSWDFSLIDPMTVDFMRRDRGPLDDPEFQHDPGVDVEDARSR